MMKADQLQIYEMSGAPNDIFPKVIIRRNGYDTFVSPRILEKMAFDIQFGEQMKDRVALYKEAIKYEQYIDFEMC